MARVTIADVAHLKRNSFGLIRLLAALAVVFSHSYLITGGIDTPEPLEGLTGFPLGAHAVHVFFTLSGLLVAASYERSASLAHFTIARVLRIYPALIVVSLATFLIALIFLTTATTTQVFTTSGYSFFAKILIGLSGGGEIAGVFASTPVPHGVNVALWTIKYEVLCYLSLAVLLKLSDRFGLAKPVGVTVLMLTVSALWMLRGVAYDAAHLSDHLARFLFAFWIGVLAWQLRAHIPLKALPLVMLSALCLLSVSLNFPCTEHLFIILAGYGAIYAGQFRFGAVTDFTTRNDLSYGTYIMAWPIQQVLVASVPSMSPLGNSFMTAAFVLPMAFLSWRFIEKPSLRLKDKYLAAAARMPTHQPNISDA